MDTEKIKSLYAEFIGYLGQTPTANDTANNTGQNKYGNNTITLYNDYQSSLREIITIS